MNNERRHVGCGRRLLLWLLPPLSLVLVGMSCSASGPAKTPPVTHLPAAQLWMLIQITGQFGDASTVQTQIESALKLPPASSAPVTDSTPPPELKSA